MTYVYLIQSISFPDRKYIGRSSNIKKRLDAHNEGRSPHTSKYKPWKLVSYIAFSDESKAREFESYLKSGSGELSPTNDYGNQKPRVPQKPSNLESGSPGIIHNSSFDARSG